MGKPSTLQIRVTSDSRQAQADMQQVEGNVGGTLSKLKTAGPAVAAAAAAAIGAAIIGAFSAAMEQGKITAKLGAQLGATPKEAAKLGKLAGKLYTEGITEDFQSAADTISAVMRSGLVPTGATEAQIQQLATQAGDLANVFGQDVQGAARAASQMIKTGMAKNATEAFDVLTRGFQTGANSADDLLDTFNEYSTQFRDMGLDGRTAMGLITQGLKGGARDADLVADAFKELNIRVKDQSAAEALKKLGFNAKEMATAFASGGPGAAKSLDALLDKLRAVKDPAERTALSVQLLGTQSEDLAGALLALDPSSAVKALGDVDGASKRVGDSMRNNASAEVERFQRTAQQKLIEFVGSKLIPVLRDLYTWWNAYIAPVIKKVAEVYLTYLSPVLAAIRDGLKKVTDRVKENRDKWEPLWKIIKEKVAPELGKLVGSGISKLFDALVGLVDVLSLLADWLGTAVGWFLKLRDAIGRIKVPSWLSDVAGFVGIGGGGSAVFQQNSTMRALAGASSTAPRSGAARITGAAFAQTTVVHVTIDGQQLQGRIDRSIKGAQQYDGARYLAGGWA